jgi:hypothetical protein
MEKECLEVTQVSVASFAGEVKNFEGKERVKRKGLTVVHCRS